MLNDLIKRFFYCMTILLVVSGCSTPVLKDRFDDNSKPAKPAKLQEELETLQNLQAKADNLYKSGNFNLAEQQYMEVLQADAKNAAALYRLGNIAFKRGDLVKAADYFSRTVELAPRNQKAHYNLAITHLTLSEQHFKYYSSMVDEDVDLTKVSQILRNIYEFAVGGRVTSETASKSRISNSSYFNRNRTDSEKSNVIGRQRVDGLSDSPPRSSNQSRQSDTNIPAVSVPESQTKQDAVMDALDSLMDQF